MKARLVWNWYVNEKGVNGFRSSENVESLASGGC
jgi:hypothetical protein